MNFTTKLSGHDIMVFNMPDGNENTMECACSIEWDFYTEIREWGVKDVGVYATKVTGVVYENDDSIYPEERHKVDSSEEEWALSTDTFNLEWGSSICPKDVGIDFKNKIITVNF